MKQKTNRLHFSTRTLAMVLSIVMLIGSIATGSMLNTFAAYLKDAAANSDAVSQAASEGSDIAKAAIPSQVVDADAASGAEKNDTNNTDAIDAPDLSGFEENEIVRGMKQDLADTGAKADLASTSGDWDATGKNNLKISFDGGNNWHIYNSNSDGYITFTVPYNCTAQWEYWAEHGGTSRKYLYKSDDGKPAADTVNATEYYARETGKYSSGLEFTASLPAGQYVVQYTGFDTYDDANYGTLKYKWYRKVAKIKGNLTGGWTSDKLQEMTYDEYADAYYYQFTGGDDKYFRFQKGDNGNTNLHPDTDPVDISSNSSKSNANTNITAGDSNAFKLPTTRGKTYRVWLAKDFGSVWWTNPEDLTTTDYYFGDSGNSWGATQSDDNKFTRNQDGTYTFQKSLTNDYEFCIRSAGGTMFRMNAQNAWEVNAEHVDSGSSYNMVSNSDGHNFAWKAGSKDVIITFNPSTPSIKFDTAPTSYYLTGLLNNSSVTTTDNSRKFTQSATQGIYTLTWTPSADNGGYQYVTIFDGTNAWHPTSHESGTGTAAGTTPDTSPGNDYKWKVEAAANQTVTFTWNTNGAAPVLSWTVSSGTLTSYKVLFGTSPSITGLSVMNGVNVYQTGTNEYTVNFSSVLGTTLKKNQDYYIAISKSANYNDILGGGAQNNGNAGTSEIKEGNTYFSTASIQNYYGQNPYNNWTFNYAHIKLQNNPSGLKFVVTNPYNDSEYKVDYDYYASNTAYSEEGGGDAAETVVVYAKDGAAPINWDNKPTGGASDVTASATKYNYAAIATTTISQIDGAAPAAGAVTTVDCGTSSSDTYRSQYQTATVEAGKTIEITTQIKDHLTWRSRYYVRGWCINGVTYTTTGAPGVNTIENANANGTYTMTYTIPAKTEANYLEITPIYYLQSNTNCITFYLEGFDEKIQTTGGWGNTPYIYPFYGNNDNVDNSFGCYPGQPMVYADGKYSIEIPMTNLLIDSGRTKNDKMDIKGITISNGYADHVHRNLIYSWTAHDNDADHKQTYDYDDFYKIYKECTKNSSGTETGAPNSIIFRIMDESTTYNRSTYGGSLSGARVVATKSSLNSTDLSNIDNGNGWELLTNRYGDPIDLFGTKVTAPATAATSMDNNALRVVSTGYNANIAGDYGTAWKVYKNNSTSFDLIQDSTNGRYAAPPSIFLLRGTTSGYDAAVAGVGYPSASHSVTGVGSYTDDIDKYEGIYKSAKAYAGKPVYISYEKNTQDTRSDATGTGAYRVDGRWYYTHSNDKVQSVVEIETKNKSTGNWDKDTFDGLEDTVGSSGNTVKFTDTNTRQSAKVDNDGTNRITFTATPGPGYEFDSWWIKYSDTNYVKIEGAGATHTMTATASDTLVARFLPASSGDLTIKHTKQGTGEGTIDMDVKVYTNSTKGTEVTGGTFTGNYVNIPSSIISNNAEHLNYYIEVTLKATPKYDGTVSSFTYDKFNANPSSGSAITATENRSATPATSTFGFTISQLYLDNVNLDTTELNYVSIIDAEDHFYEFTYDYKDRGGAKKSYTTRGTIKLADYKTYVGDTNHVLDEAFVKAKAPFESNFLMNNTLTVPTVSYTDGTKTFSVTATFTQTDSLPEYTVKFMLPYDYYTEKNVEGGYKQYTVKPNSGGSKVYDTTKAAFELKAKYDQFVTVNATIEQAGSQTSVSKVTDSTDVNHVGNDFFTAPEQLVSSDGSTTYYFQYWQIQRLADKDQASAPVVSKIYFPDLNYRIYGDYYIEPKYSTNAADWWHNTYINSSNSTDSSILYLGDSRNQWNLNGVNTDSSSSDVASDKIYSDFILAFNDKGAELKGSSAVKIGMIIERVVDNSDPSDKKWATGSADVSDMNYYKTKNYGTGYDEATVKTAIANDLNSNNRANASNIGRAGCVGVDLNTAKLNNKNYIETNYSIFSQYGQKVENHSIEFATDNAIDDYVYRAYAVIKGANGTWYVSDAAYFCTRYTANLKYSE